MTSYQTHILDTVFKCVADHGLTPTTQMAFGNVGTLLVMDDLTTVLTMHFDFQDYRVHVQFNGAKLGPRSADVYWWQPGNREDDSEITRMVARLAALMREYKGTS